MDKNILKAFGNQVRRERKKLQLSQEDFASLAGIHRTYIGVVERGEKNITLKNTGLFDTRGNFNYLAALNILVDRDANSIDINVIQCKTNWNDNAQIPMLWDMVYNAQSFKNKNTSQMGNASLELAVDHFSTGYLL